MINQNDYLIVIAEIAFVAIAVGEALAERKS